MLRLSQILAIFLIIQVSDSLALQRIELNSAELKAINWKLEDIRIVLDAITDDPQKLSLTIAKMALPKPFNDLSLVNIHCASFTWQNKELICREGKANIYSKQWLSPAFNFTFRFRENHNQLNIANFSLADANIDADLEEIGNEWHLHLSARNMDRTLIDKLFKIGTLKLKEGKLDFLLKASGRHEQIDEISVDAELAKLTLQSVSGQWASENLTLETHVELQPRNGLWHWQNQTKIKDGAVYFEPVYLDAGQQQINLQGQGSYDSIKRIAEINSFRYQHSLAADVNGTATIGFDKSPIVEKAAISLLSKDLQTFSTTYLKPFFSQTALEGISLAGELKTDISVVQQSLRTVAASFKKLAITDQAKRIQMMGGAGTVNWGADNLFTTPSELAWQQLILRRLPFGPSRVTFLSQAKNIKLLKNASIPFLGGEFKINQLSWQTKERDEPDVVFEGKLDNASLSQLSSALSWSPLSGTISSVIPRVEYRNKTLKLDGQLTLQIFDGKVIFSNLASSGLFSSFPKLQGDIEIESLDLAQLTGKFNFGSITGKLSGFVRQLYLENWQPVTFYAWMGTPDDDDSSHRISQKAVNNIASIGGGGASDLISRSFLGIFETFGYDKLGLGCYLHKGVCQLMGVKATKSGYAMITGGGLPRIDVIGYNPRVDWNVLLDRLSRITATDKVIIK
jgi:hypothetical protein